MLASKQSKKVRGSFPEESDSLAIQSGLIDWREFTGTQGVVKIADAKAHGIGYLMAPKIRSTNNDDSWIDEFWESVLQNDRMMIGWVNHCCMGPVSEAYSVVDAGTRRGCVGGYSTNTKSRGLHTNAYRKRLFTLLYGLVQLQNRTENLPWAKVRVFSESRMREIGQSGFDETGNRTKPNRTEVSRRKPRRISTGKTTATTPCSRLYSRD
jgi:hypothetical protein